MQAFIFKLRSTVYLQYVIVVTIKNQHKTIIYITNLMRLSEKPVQSLKTQSPEQETQG